MFASREVQAAALGLAMLFFWTAATVHVQGRAQGQALASTQMDVLTMMSQVQKLPEAAPPLP